MKDNLKKESIVLALASFGAGFINSLVGAGGGVLLVFSMQFFIDGIEEKSVYALTNTAIMVFSFLSVVFYINRGDVKFAEVSFYILPAIIGGFLGALLLGKIKTKHLKTVFALLTLYSGVKMIV